MPLTQEEVIQIAGLARLALTETEVALFQEQLAAILELAAALQALEMEIVPPTTSVVPLDTVLRDDVPGMPLTQAEALHNAPQTEADYFLTPPIMVQE